MDNIFSLPMYRHILVVDDQRNMRAVIALVLRGEGHSVTEAASGEEALAILATRMDVDLLLTDLKMEPMDGLTLLQRALEQDPHLTVIIMTAYGSNERKAESMRLGAFDYLQKPFVDGELQNKVARALEQSRRRSF